MSALRVHTVKLVLLVLILELSVHLALLDITLLQEQQVVHNVLQEPQPHPQDRHRVFVPLGTLELDQHAQRAHQAHTPPPQEARLVQVAQVVTLLRLAQLLVNVLLATLAPLALVAVLEHTREVQETLLAHHAHQEAQLPPQAQQQ